MEELFRGTNIAMFEVFTELFFRRMKQSVVGWLVPDVSKQPFTFVLKRTRSAANGLILS